MSQGITRREMVLAGFAPADGEAHSPVQMQKLLFLLDRNLAQALQAERFAFRPYDYGPFDPGVYNLVDDLVVHGLAVRTLTRTWSTYSLSPQGQEEGDRLLGSFPPKVQEYVRNISRFVRSVSFPELVSAIYRAYPDMRVNSVFQG